MSNDINELRGYLFDVLRGLKDGTIDTDRAKALNSTAQTIIDSARVEVQALEVLGGTGTGFIPQSALPPDAPNVTVVKTDKSITRIEERDGVTYRRHTVR